MRVCRRNLIDFYPRQRVNLRFDKIFGLGRTRTVALMLFFAEERGLRKEEDNLEEKEFVFVDVVVANIVISVFPSCCEEMLFFVQGPISVDVVVFKGKPVSGECGMPILAKSNLK